jgi:hypothetical protein
MFQTSVIFDRNYNSTAEVIVNQGGTSCFHRDTLVVTIDGNKPISEIKEGDVVLSFNEVTKTKEWKLVTEKFEYKNTKPTIKIKLRNGSEIICTDDHLFYFKGGWISAKHLVSLIHETDTKL